MTPATPSETPRVDALEDAWRESGLVGVFQPVTLCRELERALNKLERDYTALSRDCARQAATVERLREYAQHKWNCTKFELTAPISGPSVLTIDKPCSCGFDAALSGGPQEHL